MDDDWITWQLLDSAFPSGAFAHSAGLEAAWQQGFADSRADFAELTRVFLNQQARGPAVLAIATCRAPGQLGEYDALAEAMLTNHVANRASRAQGAALAHAATRTFDSKILVLLSDKITAGEICGHLSPMLGAVLKALGLSDERTGRLAIFLALRGLISASVRLGTLGAFEAQALQRSLAESAEQAAQLALSLHPLEVAQTAPVLDLLQQTQDRLYSRLFQS